MFAEMWMEQIAKVVNKPDHSVRQLNMYQVGVRALLLVKHSLLVLSGVSNKLDQSTRQLDMFQVGVHCFLF
jgi:hypothetical protein